MSETRSQLAYLSAKPSRAGYSRHAAQRSPPLTCRGADVCVRGPACGRYASTRNDLVGLGGLVPLATLSVSLGRSVRLFRGRRCSYVAHLSSCAATAIPWPVDRREQSGEPCSQPWHSSVRHDIRDRLRRRRRTRSFGEARLALGAGDGAPRGLCRIRRPDPGAGIGHCRCRDRRRA